MGTTDNPESPKIVAYSLSRPDFGGWMFAGTTPAEAAKTLEYELESNEGLSAEECGEIVIKAYETTQDEIDFLPEFEGW